jgi:hypothetical protein
MRLGCENVAVSRDAAAVLRPSAGTNQRRPARAPHVHSLTARPPCYGSYPLHLSRIRYSAARATPYPSAPRAANPRVRLARAPVPSTLLPCGLQSPARQTPTQQRGRAHRHRELNPSTTTPLPRSPSLPPFLAKKAVNTFTPPRTAARRDRQSVRGRGVVARKQPLQRHGAEKAGIFSFAFPVTVRGGF